MRAGLLPGLGLGQGLCVGLWLLTFAQGQEPQQQCGAVWLTVSSLWRATVVHEAAVAAPAERELELNWEPDCAPQWLLLFDRPPPESIDDPADEAAWRAMGARARVWAADFPDGWAPTGVGAGRPALPGGWERPADSVQESAGPALAPAPGAHCLPWWGGAYRDGHLLHAACLAVRPTWMWDHRHQLGALPLSALFLPGTHNSGCFHAAAGGANGGGGLSRRDTFARYLLTQDTDVWTQLVHGVRYLDVRVGYYATRDRSSTAHGHAARFWVNHDLLRVGPLLPLLRDLRRFLATEAARAELVVLDLHRFPVGFRGRAARHRRLIALLLRELGPFMLPPAAAHAAAPDANAAATLAQVWAQPRRLIVAYGDKAVARESKWLWGPINQMWGNQQTPSGLKSFLQQTMDAARPRGEEPQLWAAMAELTPTPLEVMFKPSGSLRQMADSINRNITTWFKHLWWQKANIVATDFFLGNDLINVAISSNLRKMNLVEAR